MQLPVACVHPAITIRIRDRYCLVEEEELDAVKGGVIHCELVRELTRFIVGQRRGEFAERLVCGDGRDIGHRINGHVHCRHGPDWPVSTLASPR